MVGTGPTTEVPLRWALLGKDPGDRGDYKVLVDSTGGADRAAFHGRITELIFGNPIEEPPGHPGGLPWVSVRPYRHGDGHRFGIAIVDWPVDRIVDRTGRRAAFVRHFDLDYEQVAAVGAGYAGLFAAVTALELPLAHDLRVTVDTTAPQAVADAIDELGFDWVVTAAALLVQRPVTLTTAGNPEVAQRLRWLDAVMGLLPYWLRTNMVVGTWTGGGNSQPVDLSFGAPSSTPGNRSAGPAVVMVGAAPEPDALGPIGTRYRALLQDVRVACGHDTTRLVTMLWHDRAPRADASPQAVLDRVSEHFLPYAVSARLTATGPTGSDRGHDDLAGARQVLRAHDLRDFATEIQQSVLDVVIAHGPPDDLTYVDQYWSEWVARKVASAALRRPVAWGNAATALARRTDPEGFAIQLIELAGNDDRGLATAVQLLVAQPPPRPGEWSAAQDCVLRLEVFGSRFVDALLDLHQPTAQAWLRWLAGGRPLPVWARPAATAVLGGGELDPAAAQALQQADARIVVRTFRTALRLHTAALLLPAVGSRLIALADDPDARSAAEAYLAVAAGPQRSDVQAVNDVLAVRIGAAVPAHAARFDRPDRGRYLARVVELAPSMTDVALLVRWHLSVGPDRPDPRPGVDLATAMLTATNLDRHVAAAFADMVRTNEELYPHVSEVTLKTLMSESDQLRSIKALHDLQSAAQHGATLHDLAQRWSDAIYRECRAEQIVPRLSGWEFADRPEQVAALLDELLAVLYKRHVVPEQARQLYLDGQRAVVDGYLSKPLAPRYLDHLAERAAHELPRWQSLSELVRQYRKGRRGILGRW